MSEQVELSWATRLDLLQQRIRSQYNPKYLWCTKVAGHKWRWDESGLYQQCDRCKWTRIPRDVDSGEALKAMMDLPHDARPTAPDSENGEGS